MTAERALSVRDNFGFGFFDQGAIRLSMVHRGVKHTGDGIMAAFDDVANAVRAAADIQKRFLAYNRGAAESLSVRIGIHAGEPVIDHNDLFGATVQLASRLCSEAEADGIVVSGFVRDLCDVDAAYFDSPRRTAAEGVSRAGACIPLGVARTKLQD